MNFVIYPCAGRVSFFPQILHSFEKCIYSLFINHSPVLVGTKIVVARRFVGNCGNSVI